MVIEDKESLCSQISVHKGSLTKRRTGIKSFYDYDNILMEQRENREPRFFRWKMLTRVILHFVRWEKLKSSGKDRGFVMRRMVAGLVQELVFNAEMFSKQVQQHQILNVHGKILLFKEPHLRSSHDIVVILGYMNRMKCFEKFSVFTKRQLAAKVRYNCYEKGTIIFTEGDSPRFFYLILSGSVQAYKTVTLSSSATMPSTEKSISAEKALLTDSTPITKSTDTSETVMKPFGKPIVEGSGFGELNMQFGEQRNCTIIAADHCECFTLEKEDFSSLLETYHDQERSMKTDVIRKLPHVTGMSDNDIKRAIDSSYIKTFAKGDIIIRGNDYCLANRSSVDTKNGSEFIDTYACFVVSGCAILEKRLFLHQDPLPCGTTIARLPKSSEQNKVLQSLTRRVRSSAASELPVEVQGKITLPPLPPTVPSLKFMSVRSYMPGDLFLPFVHEENYVIGAKDATTILFIPKTPFMLHKSGEAMIRLFDELSNARITVDELLKEYNSGRIWKDYRKQLVRWVLVDKLIRKSYP